MFGNFLKTKPIFKFLNTSHKRGEISILNQTENGTWSQFGLKDPPLTKLHFTHNMYTWQLPPQSLIRVSVKELTGNTHIFSPFPT